MFQSVLLQVSRSCMLHNRPNSLTMMKHASNSIPLKQLNPYHMLLCNIFSGLLSTHGSTIASLSKADSLFVDREATRLLVNRQTPNLELQNEMDEISQQLLHEHRQCEAKLQSMMKSEPSTPDTPISDGSDAPSTPTLLLTAFDSPQSQGPDRVQIPNIQA